MEDAFGGWGMGLPLSRMYARLFRGDLAFTTVHGKGSTVTLFLPRTPGSEDIPLTVS